MFNKLFEKWWGLFLIGAFCIFGAFLELSRLGELDDGKKESIRVSSIEYATYTAAGKWGVFSLFFIVGLGCLAWGVRKLITQPKSP